MNFEQNMQQTKESIIKLIRDTAEKMDLDPDLAQAIAAHESNFVPAVVRFEAKWSYFYCPESFASRLKITAESERALQAMSWNVMQVMGSVAREQGYSDHLTLLVDPIPGVFYACKQLKKFHDIYENEACVIAAYNAGSVRKLTEKFVNQAYVDDVMARLKRLRSAH